MSTVVIAERADIHKSCKTIETIVNILNDYCEAANAIVTIQKKLAKALRESASVKPSTEIAVNALNASATIFDALAEVDSKFVKFADKECDSVSAEVKKWFKKLAKEEKAHDDRMASANAKIKQAGQLYEKKAKKSPRDAQEEHTRYITLLSSLGPEVAQDKYNHSLNITKRHTETLYSIAACLARIADGEWLRSCEGVRRFGPNIGQLGQWRSLCEGGWTGPVPQDLPDLESNPTHADQLNATTPNREVVPLQSEAQETLERPAPEYTSRGNTPTGTLKPPPNYSAQAAQASTEAHFENEDTLKDRSHSAASIPSLAAFPSPPTHFPIPPVSTSREARPQQDAFTESAAITTSPKLMTSASIAPESDSYSASPRESAEGKSASESMKLASQQEQQSRPSASQQYSRQSSSSNVVPSNGGSRSAAADHLSSSSSTSTSVSASNPGSRTQPQAPEASLDAELSVRGNEEATQQRSAIPSSIPRAIERHDTGKSTGSVVANLRDKYTRAASPPSPGQRDTPRPTLNTSVSNLALRYDTTYSSQVNLQRSPTEERRRVSSDVHIRPPNMQSYDQTSSTSQGSHANSPSLHPRNSALLRQPIAETRESELQERERQLRLREQEILQSARELERQRMALQNTRQDMAAKDIVNTNTRYHPTTDRSQALTDSPSSSPHPHNAARLPVHTSTNYSNSSNPSSRSLVNASPSPILPGEHAPYCGCEACSVSQYKTRGVSPARGNLRQMPMDPPISLRPEKPKGWIRRLSMPVAFSLNSESKKGISSHAVFSNAAGSRNSLALPDEYGRLRGDLVGNRSSVNLTRGR